MAESLLLHGATNAKNNRWYVAVRYQFWISDFNPFFYNFGWTYSDRLYILSTGTDITESCGQNANLNENPTIVS